LRVSPGIFFLCRAVPVFAPFIRGPLRVFVFFLYLGFYSFSPKGALGFGPLLLFKVVFFFFTIPGGPLVSDPAGESYFPGFFGLQAPFLSSVFWCFRPGTAPRAHSSPKPSQKMVLLYPPPKPCPVFAFDLKPIFMALFSFEVLFSPFLGPNRAPPFWPRSFLFSMGPGLDFWLPTKGSLADWGTQMVSFFRLLQAFFIPGSPLIPKSQRMGGYLFLPCLSFAGNLFFLNLYCGSSPFVLKCTSRPFKRHNHRFPG